MDLDQYRELARQVKSAVNIADLIAEHTQVRAHGKESVASCPFHKDSTPSMGINSEKGVYLCRGCGATGDAIKFLSEISGMTMGESIIALAKKHSIPIPSSNSDKSKPDYVKRDLDFLSSVTRDYQAQLSGFDGGSALNELRRRGVTDTTIKKFELGFGGKGWEKPKSLTGSSDKEKFVLSKCAGRTGVLSEKQWHYMSERIVFPIRDEQGMTRGFGGRKIEGEGVPLVDSPKYINTPETAYFKKGNLLYGAFEAKNAIRQSKQAIIVEGYMDTILLHQEGFENAVGAMSASIDAGVINRLWRNIDDLVVCLDGDSAGLKGVMRIIESAAESYSDGKKIRVALLPDGMDPDEFVLAKGKQAFEALIENAIPASNFIVRYHAKQCDMASSEGRGGFLKRVNDVADLFASAPYFKEQLKSQAQTYSDLRAFASAITSGVDAVASDDKALTELSELKDRIGDLLERVERDHGNYATPSLSRRSP